MKKAILFLSIFSLFCLNLQAQIRVSGNITANTTWTKDNTYLLQGFVYVKNGATLTIEPGTVIKGDKTSRSTLIITRGAKIIADGTREQPIVFTSNEAAPRTGDWGGLVLLGRAATNAVFTNAQGVASNGLGAIEGDINNAAGDGLYGGGDLPNGPDNNDNSGILRYVRIEYPGVVISQGNEINGLTLGGVGRGTIIDYVQVSYSNDDSFEWFGGTVNCRHLIAYRGVDDDFDTDFGYSGNVQFAFAVRDPNVWDGASGGSSNGIESDNDGTGSAALPKTKPTFSNLTIVGPQTLVTGNQFSRGILLRRNTEHAVFNSVVLGLWPNAGIRIDAQTTVDNATSGKLEIKNTHVAGVTTPLNTNITTFDPLNWFNTTGFGNAVAPTAAAVQLTAPYDLIRPNAVPLAISPVFNSASFAASRLQDAFFDKNVTFRGAFGRENGLVNDWTCGWAAFEGGNNNCTVSVGNFYAVVNRLSVAPSVTTDYTDVQLDLKEACDIAIRLCDIQGNVLQTLAAHRANAGANHFRMDVSTLPAGLYFVQASAGKGVKTEKIVVGF